MKTIGPPTGDAAGGRHVEVTRVADHDHVGLVLAPPGEVALGAEDPRELTEAERPVVPLPDLAMELEHLDARAAEARDDLGVPGRGAVVRPEVERLHVACD